MNICRKDQRSGHKLQLLLQMLRARIGSLLENLMFFFQVDVIEPHFGTMYARLDFVQEQFETCVEAHREMLHFIAAEVTVERSVT